LLVRPGAEADGGAGEQLGLGGHLRMHLKPQDDFPGAGAAFDQFGFSHGRYLGRRAFGMKRFRKPSPAGRGRGPSAQPTGGSGVSAPASFAWALIASRTVGSASIT